MEPPGKAITFIGKFTAGMQLGQNDLDTGNPLFRVEIHGHAAPIIQNLDAAIRKQGHFDIFGKSR